MIKQHTGIWHDYCERSGRAPACGFTSFYPTISGMIAQSGDHGVAGYVAQSFAEGAIGYVNYSYALEHAASPSPRCSTRRLLHRADAGERRRVAAQGPDQHRRERPSDYLTQNLDDVYTDTDPRNYPLSSYSYLILPTTVAGPVQRGQGQDARRVRVLRDVPGPAAVGVARLLADADQPRRRPASTRSARSPASWCRTSTSRTARTRRSRPTATTCSPTTRRSRRRATSRAPTQCATGTGGAKKVSTPVKPAAGGGRWSGLAAAGGWRHRRVHRWRTRRQPAGRAAAPRPRTRPAAPTAVRPCSTRQR